MTISAKLLSDISKTSQVPVFRQMKFILAIFVEGHPVIISS